MWPSAHHFNCDGATDFDIATLHCMSGYAAPSSLSTRWSCTFTGFGRGLRSIESYFAETSDYSATPATLSIFTTTGPFIIDEYRDNGNLWAMAVQVMSTVS
jgi:hypothetical protein